MKSTAKQENKFNFKRNIYIPKMCVDLGPGGLQQYLEIFLLKDWRTINNFSLPLQFHINNAHNLWWRHYRDRLSLTK